MITYNEDFNNISEDGSDYIAFETHDKASIYLSFKSEEEWDGWLVNKEYALKNLLRCLLDGVKETSDENQAMMAHLAGYDVADKRGNVWKSSQKYHCSHFSFSPPYRIIRPNEKPETVTVPRAELEALRAEHAEMGKRLDELEKRNGRKN